MIYFPLFPQSIKFSDLREKINYLLQMKKQQVDQPELKLFKIEKTVYYYK